ncbi:Pyrimidine-specific ribonucleoside hydrolase RihB [Jeotgalicoccus aerolatus]|uniref:Pyrimidine-specific ribonucleoside hydrolase/ribosylpyrimidine nucleosidase n=1 Tax=Jeotgalicoccus aerolatus TaxID=709510 RepID=A0ABS4HPQ7_9STAP|nr:nucleoside hydrolase [Jeotgalicoccus aerolatus]MBP1952893.1 pyrimidine-specific ribonucleoside hydrolase/ribosylpyrimidine nucleosidase [Jeotgalicoccus aerolatus]GGE07170.1 ribonucleoside hydrolase [Jeotgalicoccus aerolatus]CAD2080306.1 Pyrimidine-specific ribonucleoside hydrolase RihB [Jeotgalicoccus aerolatus]
MSKINVWIDCDPGIDDAIALAAAAASQDALHIHGISTVAGNQTIERVTNNALALSSFLKLDVPVVRGAEGPLTRAKEDAGHVHGETGLGNTVLPKTGKQAEKGNTFQLIRDAIMNLPEDEKMTLVPVGPLTNIALLLKVYPEVNTRIKEIVLMGGGTFGNRTPTAEFNIWGDPEAAKIVFDSDLPIVMCGLDVTHKSGLDRNQVEAMFTSQNEVQKAFGDMLKFYFDSPAYINSDLVHIHDAVAVIYVTNPEIFKGIQVSVDVDCTDDINRGMTVCDLRKTAPEAGRNVTLLNDIDLTAFQNILLEKLSSL